MIQFLDSRLPDRFWDKVQPCPMTGCWIWSGATNGGGYGQYRHDGKYQYAHRVTVSVFVGAIPSAKEIDHLCRVPACCNPAHLEPVPRSVNVRRGRAGAVLVAGNRERWAKITHCPYGHSYAGDNLYVSRAGTRACNACKVRRRRLQADGPDMGHSELRPASPEMLAWADRLLVAELEKIPGGITRKPSSKFEEVAPEKLPAAVRPALKAG